MTSRTRRQTTTTTTKRRRQRRKGKKERGTSARIQKKKRVPSAASTTDALHSNIVYCLSNGGTHSYVGVTHNMTRRLRQHNGEIRGGARYTTNIKTQTGRPWTLAFIITGLPDRGEALRLEWRLHRRLSAVSNAARNPFGPAAIDRRAWQLQKALQMERVTASATPTAQLTLRIFWHAALHYHVATSKHVPWPASVSHRTGGGPQ